MSSVALAMGRSKLPKVADGLGFCDIKKNETILSGGGSMVIGIC